jgi:hypothetical protein
MKGEPNLRVNDATNGVSILCGHFGFHATSNVRTGVFSKVILAIEA